MTSDRRTVTAPRGRRTHAVREVYRPTYPAAPAEYLTECLQILTPRDPLAPDSPVTCHACRRAMQRTQPWPVER